MPSVLYFFHAFRQILILFTNLMHDMMTFLWRKTLAIAVPYFKQALVLSGADSFWKVRCMAL